MKKFGYAMLVSAFILTGMQSSSAAPKTVVKKVPPPPDYFPLTKDYWWKYESSAPTGQSEFEVKVIDAEKKPDGTVIYDVNTTIKGKSQIGTSAFDEWYVKPKGLVNSLRMKNAFNGQVSEYTPPRQYIENPLKIGSTWTWTGTRFANIETTENNTVEDVEEVEVPAGKFKTMRVVTQIVQGGSPVTKTYWYAPWVGLVKSRTESGGVVSDTQLTDYSFKPKPKIEIIK